MLWFAAQVCGPKRGERLRLRRERDCTTTWTPVLSQKGEEILGINTIQSDYLLEQETVKMGKENLTVFTLSSTTTSLVFKIAVMPYMKRSCLSLPLLLFLTCISIWPLIHICLNPTTWLTLHILH